MTLRSFLRTVALLMAGPMLPAFSPGAACAAEAAVYNLRLLSDNVPDYTDIASLVASSTGAWKTPEQKCIAVWRWARRARRQTSCAIDDGRHIIDPILHYNSYGAMNCGIVSSLNITSWLQLGYRGRYIQLGDHTVSEVSWDDGAVWHLFDSSMSIFCYNHAGTVASCEDIKQPLGCELSSGKVEPGHCYYYHYAPQCGSHSGPTGWRMAADDPVGYGRTLEAGASSYTDGYSVDRYCQMARWGHRYVLNLRRGESYTRYWEPLDDARNAGDPATNDPDYFRPMANGSDPDDQHGLNNIRGNGLWTFAPELSEPRCAELFYDSANIALGGSDSAGARLRPAEARQPAFVVFHIAAANVITSMRIEAAARGRGDGSRLEAAVSRDAGLNWRTVWKADGRGAETVELKLRDEVAGWTHCWVKFEMRSGGPPGDVGLDALRVTTITQLNRRTLPRLERGANRLVLLADEQLETVEIHPALHGGKYKETVVEAVDVFSDEQPDGMYKATLGAGVDDKLCSATWRLDVPTEIADFTVGAIVTNRSPSHFVSLRHSWDGKRFEEFYRKQDGDFPFDKQVVHTFAGDEVPRGARTAWFRGEFYCRGGAATYGMPGLQDVLLRLRHRPRAARFEPIEVTYEWTEHRAEGDVRRRHVERVASLPHRWTIHVAGRRDPTMHSVRLNFQGEGPDGAAVRYGYSDGVDVGPGFERRKVAYRWGRSIAFGAPYTSSRPSSRQSGNPDTDGKELTNGMRIAPTEIAQQPAVQPATAFWDAGEPVELVVDLGAPRRVGGFRVTTHQPNARYCHPASIEIAVSTDAERWQPAGRIGHDDLWNPPGDYEPWEHDDDPSYDALPAGGRLAYAYPVALDAPVEARYVRFTCAPLEGRGLGLSELEVFDAVTVEPWPEEIVLP